MKFSQEWTIYTRIYTHTHYWMIRSQGWPNASSIFGHTPRDSRFRRWFDGFCHSRQSALPVRDMATAAFTRHTEAHNSTATNDVVFSSVIYVLGWWRSRGRLHTSAGLCWRSCMFGLCVITKWWESPLWPDYFLYGIKTAFKILITLFVLYYTFEVICTYII